MTRVHFKATAKCYVYYSTLGHVCAQCRPGHALVLAVVAGHNGHARLGHQRLGLALVPCAGPGRLNHSLGHFETSSSCGGTASKSHRCLMDSSVILAHATKAWRYTAGEPDQAD